MKEENSELQNERFVMHPNDVTMRDNAFPDIETENAVDFLKQRKARLLTNNEEAEIGDIVQIKWKKGNLIIRRKNVDGFKYGGSYKIDDKEIFMFNQEGLEKIVDKSGRKK